jgi:hypothetical protein
MVGMGARKGSAARASHSLTTRNILNCMVGDNIRHRIAGPEVARRRGNLPDGHAEGGRPMRLGAFWKGSHRMAQMAICVQFLALVRTLAEFFRLQYVEGPTLTVATVAPYVGAGLLCALLTWTGVLCYFCGRDRAAIGVASVTILALLIVKVAVIAP